MGESTASMDDILDVGGKNVSIMPVLEANFSNLDNRIREARPRFLTDRECMYLGVTETLLGIGVADTMSADMVGVGGRR